MSIIILAVVALLMAASVLAGLAASRHRLNVGDDYFLAGRQLPWYAVAISLALTGLGLESMLGMAGLAYKVGMAPAALCWGNFLAYSLLLWVVLPYFVRKQVSSTADFLERRYHRPARAVYAVLMLAYMVFGVLAPALYAGGWVLCEAGLGRPAAGSPVMLAACVAVVALTAALYSVYGGLRATTWAGVLQLAVVLAGGGLLVAVGSHELGGLAAVAKKNLAADPARMSLLLPAGQAALGWPGLVMFAFTLSLGYTACTQLSVGRCLGARSEWDAKMGVVGAGLLAVVLPAVLVLPGLLAFARFGPYYISAATPDRIYLRLSEAVFSSEGFWGPLGQALAASALVAAALGVVGSVLNAASTLWSIDIAQDMLLWTVSEADLIRRGRWSSLVALLAGAAATPLVWWWNQGILAYVLEATALVAPPLVVVFLAAFFWPRVHGRAATFTLLAGVVTGALCRAAAFALLEPPPWLLSPLVRAGINLVLCVLLLGASTFLIPQNAGEMYDPDTAWNLDAARLPDHERRLGAGHRNLVFWWAVMLAATIAAWLAF
jgi:SSS family solute:Na+ symporter